MRLFFAIPLPDHALDAVAEALRPIRGSAPEIGWTRRGHIHLTLKFLGEVDPDRVDAVANAVAPWVRRLPLSPIRLVGGGGFPDARRPKVLWVGAEAQLGPLVGAMEASLAPLGFPPEERPFVPHVTVGRVRHGRADRVAAALRELGEVATFTPTSVILYESRPSPEGVQYVAVRTFEG